MTADQIKPLIVAALEELKAFNIVTLDVSAQTSITDLMIIASGRSSRQVKAIAEKVLETAKTANVPVLGTEGQEQAEWILVDLGDVIVHIMHPTTRSYYQLEKLWDTSDKSLGATSQQ